MSYSSHMGSIAIGLASSVLFWYSLRQGLEACLGREAKQRVERKCSLLMTAHAVLIITLHVSILAQRVHLPIPPTPTAPGHAAPGDQPTVSWGRLMSAQLRLLEEAWKLAELVLRAGMALLLSVFVDLIGQAAEVEMLSKMAKTPFLLALRLVLWAKRNRWAVVAVGYIAMGSRLAAPLMPSRAKAVVSRIASTPVEFAFMAPFVVDDQPPGRTANLASAPALAARVLRSLQSVVGCVLGGCWGWVGWLLQWVVQERPVNANLLSKLICSAGSCYLFSSLRKMAGEPLARTDHAVFTFLLGGWVGWYVPFSHVVTARVCLGLSSYFFGVSVGAECMFWAREETHLFNLVPRLMARVLTFVVDERPWSCVGGMLVYAGSEVIRWSMGSESLLLAAGFDAVSESMHLNVFTSWSQRCFEVFLGSPAGAGALIGLTYMMKLRRRRRRRGFLDDLFVGILEFLLGWGVLFMGMMHFPSLLPSSVIVVLLRWVRGPCSACLGVLLIMDGAEKIGKENKISYLDHAFETPVSRAMAALEHTLEFVAPAARKASRAARVVFGLCLLGVRSACGVLMSLVKMAHTHRLLVAGSLLSSISLARLNTRTCFSVDDDGRQWWRCEVVCEVVALLGGIELVGRDQEVAGAARALSAPAALLHAIMLRSYHFATAVATWVALQISQHVVTPMTRAAKASGWFLLDNLLRPVGTSLTFAGKFVGGIGLKYVLSPTWHRLLKPILQKYWKVSVVLALMAGSGSFFAAFIDECQGLISHGSHHGHRPTAAGALMMGAVSLLSLAAQVLGSMGNQRLRYACQKSPTKELY